jgi:hypothetical protein
MTDTSLFPIVHDPVAVLFHPSTVPVIDVFRSIGNLDDQYDLALLDAPEHHLSPHVGPTAAKGIVSDALLLAFAFTRQRGRGFHHRPLRSRQGSLDEYCLMTLIGASRHQNLDLAREVSILLDLSPFDLLSNLAGELARQMGLGSIVFPVPSLREFRAMTGSEGGAAVITEAAFTKSERHFSF